MLSEKDFLCQMEHYRDLLREAEKERLIRQATSKPAGQNHPYSRALNWLGRQLVAYGYRLQQRFGNATEARPLQFESQSAWIGNQPRSDVL